MGLEYSRNIASKTKALILPKEIYDLARMTNGAPKNYPENNSWI